MNQLSEIRDSLHRWIDNLPEQDLPLLKSVMEAERGEKHAYTRAQMEELLKRRAGYLAGEGKNYSPEEALALIRKGRR